jgi:hypothetical protein
MLSKKALRPRLGCDKRQNREEGIALANRALRTSSNDAHVLGPAAYVLGYFEQDMSPAITLMDRSLQLNPSFAIGWHWSGWLAAYRCATRFALKVSFALFLVRLTLNN